LASVFAAGLAAGLASAFAPGLAAGLTSAGLAVGACVGLAGAAAAGDVASADLGAAEVRVPGTGGRVVPEALSQATDPSASHRQMMRNGSLFVVPILCQCRRDFAERR
jgi:hypothetical protein